MTLHDLDPMRVIPALPDDAHPVRNKPTGPSEMVREFHERFSIAINVPLSDERTAALRMRLLNEEFDELLVAVAGEEPLAVADALADLTYVIHGSAITWGLELDLWWDLEPESDIGWLIERLAEHIADGDLDLVGRFLAGIRDAVRALARRWRVDLDAALAEVHRSNMTKNRPGPERKPRKGPGYSPPDLRHCVPSVP